MKVNWKNELPSILLWFPIGFVFIYAFSWISDHYLGWNHYLIIIVAALTANWLHAKIARRLGWWTFY